MKLLRGLFIFTCFVWDIFPGKITICVNNKEVCSNDIANVLEDLKTYIIKPEGAHEDVFNVDSYLKKQGNEFSSEKLFYYSAYVKIHGEDKLEQRDIDESGKIASGFITFGNNFYVEVHALTEKAIRRIKDIKINRFELILVGKGEKRIVNSDISPFKDVDIKASLKGWRSLERWINSMWNSSLEKYIQDKVDKNLCLESSSGYNHLTFCPPKTQNNEIGDYSARKGYYLGDFLNSDNEFEVVAIAPCGYPVNLEFEYKIPEGTKLRDDIGSDGYLKYGHYGDPCFLRKGYIKYFYDKNEITIDKIKAEACQLMKEGDDQAVSSDYYNDEHVQYKGGDIKYSKDNIYEFEVEIPEKSERLKSIFIDVNFNCGYLGFSADQFKCLNGLYIIHATKFVDGDEGKADFINQLKEKRNNKVDIPDNCIDELANAFYNEKSYPKSGSSGFSYDYRTMTHEPVAACIKGSDVLKPYITSKSGGSGGVERTGDGAGGSDSGSGGSPANITPPAGSDTGNGTKKVNLSRPVKKKKCCCDCCCKCCR